MSYFLSRLAYLFTLWVGVIAATFILFHVVPTDPVRTMLGPNASEEQVASLRHSLELDKPVAAQFISYIARVATFDFGHSFIDARPVGAEVKRKLILSAVLAAMAVIIVTIYLTVTVALERGGGWHRLRETTDFLCVSLPTLFSSVVVALLAVAYFPYTRFSGELTTIEDWLFLLPPAFVLALYPMGILGRIARAQMRQISDADYVRAARARGISGGTVLRSYILRNSLVPLLAALGNQLPLLLTSTFIVEIVFSVPGIGALLLKSVLERDLPMLEGIVLATSLLTIGISLVLELLYPLADPRIRKAHAT
jgi:peptide/nickel transport system permease protein